MLYVHPSAVHYWIHSTNSWLTYIVSNLLLLIFVTYDTARHTTILHRAYHIFLNFMLGPVCLNGATPSSARPVRSGSAQIGDGAIDKRP